MRTFRELVMIRLIDLDSRMLGFHTTHSLAMSRAKEQGSINGLRLVCTSVGIVEGLVVGLIIAKMFPCDWNVESTWHARPYANTSPASASHQLISSWGFAATMWESVTHRHTVPWERAGVPSFPSFTYFASTRSAFCLTLHERAEQRRAAWTGDPC